MYDAEKEHARKKRDYEWYKSLGLCVKCHKQPSEPGKTLCLTCMMDKRERDRKQVRSPESIEKHKAYLRGRREKQRAEGICVVCGKHKAIPGKSYCVYCKATSRAHRKQRRIDAGILPRDLMGADGTCYFCGKPVAHDGDKLCPKHQAQYRELMLHARSCRKSENLFEKTCHKDFELRHIELPEEARG